MTPGRCEKWGPVAAGWLTTLLVAQPNVLAQPSAKATVTGGRDASGQIYAWTITNHHTSPIVYVEIPHYHADSFSPPAVGWTQHCTNLRKIGGGADAPGICTATAEPGGLGIQPGSSEKFSLRLERSGANRGRGTIKLRFADKSTFDVANVELPIAPGLFERFGTAFTLATLLLLFLLFQLLRKKRGPATKPLQSA